MKKCSAFSQVSDSRNHSLAPRKAVVVRMYPRASRWRGTIWMWWYRPSRRKTNLHDVRRISENNVL